MCLSTCFLPWSFLRACHCLPYSLQLPALKISESLQLLALGLIEPNNTGFGADIAFCVVLQATVITFTNKSPFHVRALWMDFTGNEVSPT